MIGTAVAAGGQVYAAVAFKLLAFDVVTGDRTQLTTDRDLATEPMVFDGIVIVSTDGTAVAELPSCPRSGSLPLVTEEQVVVATGRGDLRAIRRTDGESGSRVQFPSNRLYAPVRTDGRTYVTDEAGRLFVVRDGAVERRIKPAEIDGSSGLAAIDSNRSPVVTGSSVVFPARDGTLVALSTENPDTDVRRLAHLPFRVAAPPTIVESAMFVSAHPKTYALSI